MSLRFLVFILMVCVMFYSTRIIWRTTKRSQAYRNQDQIDDINSEWLSVPRDEDYASRERGRYPIQTKKPSPYIFDPYQEVPYFNEDEKEKEQDKDYVLDDPSEEETEIKRERKPLKAPDVKKIVYQSNLNLRFYEEKEFEPLYREVAVKPLLKGKKPEAIKIAVVKQDVYANLYCSNSKNGDEVVKSTLKHQGPVGFFAPSLNTSYLILETEFNSPDTSQWKEKVTDCHFKGTLEEMYEKRYNALSVVDRKAACNQASIALGEESVDWSQFDIVVSIDIAITKKTIAKHPEVVWAYFITEGCMGSYKSSYDQPVEQYDIFLTQNFNMKTPETLKPHIIEFPFTFSYGEIFFDIKHMRRPQPFERSGMVLCRGHSLTTDEMNKLALLTKDKVEEMWGSPAVLVERFMKAKYFVYIREKGVSSRGNAVAEAMAGGALLVAGDNLTNRDLIKYSNTLVRSFDELYSLIGTLEANPDLYEKYLIQQRRMFDFLLFHRPLYQLIERSKAVLESRGLES